MSNHRKAPTGSSHKTGMGKSPSKPGLGKLHGAGKTVPSFNAARIDKMKEHSGTGGVKK